MNMYTNLLVQLFQLVLGLAAELLDVSTCVCPNLHLGASCKWVYIIRNKEIINIYIYIYLQNMNQEIKRADFIPSRLAPSA